MAKCLLFVFGLLALCCQVNCQDSKYANYTLLKITPYTERHLEALARIFADADEVKFLKRSYRVNETTDVLVSPNKRKVLERLAHKNGMPVEYKHYYGRSSVPVERGPQKRSLHSFDMFKFNSYEAIKSYIEDLPELVSHLVTLEEIGRSFEGRILYLIKISLNPEANHPIIFIDAGMEGRDWVGPAMAMYSIRRLAKDSRALERELRGVDWYIIPVVNPDGYEFTRSHPNNRLWKKTRSTTASEECPGADINRNFDFKWGVSGASDDPCADNFSGLKPFSEIEAQLVGNIMNEHRDRIKLYVSLHSYGQYLLYPWGYTNAFNVRKYKRLDNLANIVSDFIVRGEGVPFEVMSAGMLIKPVAGSSDDYAFGALGVPYAYRMLLTEGFEYTLPKELLSVVLPQYYEGFRAFALQIRKEFTDF